MSLGIEETVNQIWLSEAKPNFTLTIHNIPCTPSKVIPEHKIGYNS